MYKSLNCTNPITIEPAEPSLINKTDVPYRQCSALSNQHQKNGDDGGYYDDRYFNVTGDDYFATRTSELSYLGYVILQCSENTDIPVRTNSFVTRFAKFFFRVQHLT
jgi:hypothetical protein